ncbi:hypothetical protein FD04_GL001335 [Secundilactobacillus odoratitofui DSM 19909 = JCM 15043]|uniref:DUF2187 domain-containing protein n=1 Tax=Secundilactobacillus odoratitofui DSM 19909 = JCM 15043 TaxID=1423776 RepID=A0A0R1LPA1_9LACO|nr:hypothetical protein [Secundilactobacillus odoratitofui]KRK97320.1 hypothetical protein FD04_GL001335 [Secundilactobacillus odoratitofui DSM 19909 = JCM 15043]
MNTDNQLDPTKLITQLDAVEFPYHKKLVWGTVLEISTDSLLVDLQVGDDYVQVDVPRKDVTHVVQQDN